MIRLIRTTFLCLSFFAAHALAVDLLTPDEAVKRMFLTAEKTETETKTLSADQLSKLTQKLGGKLYAIKKPAGADDSKYTIYYGLKGGKRTSMAIIEEQEDKWGALQFIIVVDLATKKVENMAMLKYVDGRARSLSNRSFLKSFFGKGSADPITLGKDIDGVSGATVSSDMLCFMVKKVLALCDLLG